MIITTDTDLVDFGEAILEAVGKLAEFERRPASAVLGQVLLPPGDLLAFREISPEAEAGNLPLDHAFRMIDGVRKMLLSKARSVLAPQPYHPRLSRGDAEEFLSRCRLGQTERGSFILTIARPLDLKTDLLGPRGAHFSRRVTTTLIQALEELSLAADRTAIDDLADTARHPGISANLCESLLLLRPAGDRSSLNVTAWWSRVLPPEGGE